MSPTDYILAVLAAFGGLAGLALLYAVWRKPGRPSLLALGWGLVLASLVVWFEVNLDRGLAQVTSFLMLVVAATITWPGLRGTNGLQTSVREREVPVSTPRSALQRTGDIGSGIWTFLLAGPIMGAISIYAGGALLRVTKPETGSPTNAVVTAFMLSLVLWALLSALVLMEKRKLRRTFYAVAALAVVLCAALI
jgi:hypothetical protein